MKHLKVESKDHISYVTLNRPEKRNAFHPEMISELTQVFKLLDSSKDRAVVLSGAGESFCSGGDLEWMKSMASYTFDENKKDSEALFDMYETGRACRLPIIGRIHGHAFGGGLGLVAICDIVASESNTKFCFSEVKWGLVPAVISSFVLRKMTPHLVREYMLTAKVFDANSASMAGLVHFSGSQTQVDSYITETLKLLKSAGPEAVVLTKKLLNELELQSARESTTRLIAERRVSPEGQAGLKSFLEKKPAPWV